MNEATANSDLLRRYKLLVVAFLIADHLAQRLDKPVPVTLPTDQIRLDTVVGALVLGRSSLAVVEVVLDLALRPLVVAGNILAQ